MSGDGSWGTSQGLRTYKRRKQTRSSLETKDQQDGRSSVEGASKLADQINNEPWEHHPGDHSSLNSSEVVHKQWRNFVLSHMYQSLSDDEGGIRGCIRDALMMTESDSSYKDKRKSSSQTGWMSNGTQFAAEGHASAMSNGILDKSHSHTVTELCQHAFLDILLSEKFTSLCKLLFENFQGIKADNLFSLNLLNRKMKEGVYENLPIHFCKDIQQLWRKLEGTGAELMSFAKSLSDISRTCYIEQVGGTVGCESEGGKNEFYAQESGSYGKPEQKEACIVYKVYTCTHCRGKVDEMDCLVCDSCEEMYHFSCIKPAVKEIPQKSWYCTNCTAGDTRSPHENCTVCERKNAPRNQFNQAGERISPRNGEMFNEFEESLRCRMDNFHELPASSQNSCLCKPCGSRVDNGEKLKICNHPYCKNKYYHVQCLTNKQLKSYGPCWYCPSCLCRTCLTDRDDDKIVLCDGCDQACHFYCMNPPRSSVPKGKWFCRHCNDKILAIRKARREYEKEEKNLRKKGKRGKQKPVEMHEEESDQGRKGKGKKDKQKPVETHEEESDQGREGMHMLLTAALTCEEN